MNQFKICLILIFSAFFTLKKAAAQGKSSVVPYRFILEDYDLTEENNKAIGNGIALMVDIYSNGFGFYFEDDLKVKIRIFEEYFDYKIHQMGHSRTTTNSAFYSFKLNEAVVWNRKSNQQLQRDIFHEVNHLLMRNIKSSGSSDFRYRPYWINEGMSEYFEMLRPGQQHCRVEPQLVKFERCREWLLNDELPDLNTYFAMTNLQWKRLDSKNSQYMARTVAWSLVHYMLSQENGADITAKVLQYLEQNQRQEAASLMAIEQVVPGGVAQLQQNWHNWLRLKPAAHLYKNNGQTIELMPTQELYHHEKTEKAR